MGEVVSIDGGDAWPKCKLCFDTGWVCEDHPWKAERLADRNACACGCGVAMPCSCYTTRRAPHMERFTEIRPVTMRDYPDAHLLFLKVGNQQFTVGDALETKEEAEWSRDMLCIALDRLRRGEDL